MVGGERPQVREGESGEGARFGLLLDGVAIEGGEGHTLLAIHAHHIKGKGRCSLAGDLDHVHHMLGVVVEGDDQLRRHGVRHPVMVVISAEEGILRGV